MYVDLEKKARTVENKAFYGGYIYQRNKEELNMYADLEKKYEELKSRLRRFEMRYWLEKVETKEYQSLVWRNPLICNWGVIYNAELSRETVEWLEEKLGANQSVLKDFGDDWYKKHAVLGVKDKYGDTLCADLLETRDLYDLMPLRIDIRKLDLFKVMYPRVYISLEDDLVPRIITENGVTYYEYYTIKCK